MDPTMRLFVPFLVALCCTGVRAQTTILTGSTARTARTVDPHLHNLAMAGDGSMWTVVANPDGIAGTSDTLLRKSTDGGKTWSGSYFFTTKTQTYRGGIYIGEDGFTLHAVWTDTTSGFLDLHYQTFDTTAGKWIGSPLVIQKGSSSYKWYTHDILVTRAGTVVIGASTGVGGGPGFRGQSTVVFIKKHGTTAFSPPLKVNKGTATVADIGRLPALQAQDELVHIIYRTKRSPTSGIHYGFSYRSLDAVKMTFQQANDVHIGPNDNAGVNGGRNLATALDAAGNMHCVYVSPNKLRMSFGPNGKMGTNAGWKDLTITADQGLLGGNSPTVHYSHFSVTSGPPGLVHVIYSKLSEGYKNLYIQTFILGQPLIKPPANNERLLRAGSTNSYVKVNADSDTRKFTGGFAVTSGTPLGFARGIVQFHDIANDPARTVELGVSCQGTLANYPRLRAQKRPLIGKAFDVLIDRMPNNAPFFVSLGGPFSKAPIDLGVIGAPKCHLYNFGGSLVVGLTASATGTFAIGTTLPNNPALRGTSVNLQAAVVAAGANSANLVTTNYLGIFF
jgi:hypothetical protein